VLTLDGQPAALIYSRLCDTSPDILRDAHLTLTTGRLLGTQAAFGHYRVNVATFFTPRGGLAFTQPVREGAVLTVMATDPGSLIAAGQKALHKAMLRGAVTSPALVLAFSCALRTKLLGTRLGEEITVIQKALPGVPVVGFYSFGEQGLCDDGLICHANAVISVLVIGRELSEGAHVALENQRLRRELAQRDKLFDLTLDLLAVATFEGYFTEVNPAWSKTLGWSRAELLEPPFLDFVHPEDRAATLAAMERLQNDQCIINFKNRYRCKDGSYRWLSWSSYPARKEKLILSVARDVTELTQWEVEREGLITELQEALAQVKTLKGFLPMCSSCKKIRDDQGYWQQLEAYLKDHSEAEFTHSICPDCAKKLYGDYLKE
jgi:PAS domain S-box-containing protein